MKQIRAISIIRQRGHVGYFLRLRFDDHSTEIRAGGASLDSAGAELRRLAGKNFSNRSASSETGCENGPEKSRGIRLK